MKTTTEIEIKVSDAKVTNAVVMPDGTCKITIEKVKAVPKVTVEKKNELFVRVEASKLSMNDEFMQYTPQTYKERELKMLLEDAIERGGLKDFKRPKYDPSFNEGSNEGEICYKPGKAPAVGKSYDWWNQVAKKFKPEYNSRLGTKTEYVAFLGVLIKKLVKSGWSVKDAWDAVCNNSKELGHYCNSDNDNDGCFEVTGCRKICGFYDLANCFKILAEDKEDCSFWIAGGYCRTYGNEYPLADLCHVSDHNDNNHHSVGWIVID